MGRLQRKRMYFFQMENNEYKLEQRVPKRIRLHFFLGQNDQRWYIFICFVSFCNKINRFVTKRIDFGTVCITNRLENHTKFLYQFLIHESKSQHNFYDERLDSIPKKTTKMTRQNDKHITKGEKRIWNVNNEKGKWRRKKVHKLEMLKKKRMFGTKIEGLKKQKKKSRFEIRQQFNTREKKMRRRRKKWQKQKPLFSPWPICDLETHWNSMHNSNNNKWNRVQRDATRSSSDKRTFQVLTPINIVDHWVDSSHFVFIVKVTGERWFAQQFPSAGQVIKIPSRQHVSIDKIHWIVYDALFSFRWKTRRWRW